MRIKPQSAKSTHFFDQPSPESIAIRIRKLRKERGWSLSEVEKLSHGSLKAIVLGSYERGDRSLSIKRAIELANFYGVPLNYLIAPADPSRESPPYLIIDIRRLKNCSEIDDERIRLFTAFVARIVNQRRDWNGEVLSLRQSDISILRLMLGGTEEEIVIWMQFNQFLFTVPGHP